MPHKVLRSDVTDTAAGTNTNLTELSTPVAAGETIWFRAVFAWSITDAADGAQFIVDVPGSPTFLAFTAKQGSGASADTILNSVSDGGEISATTSVATGGNLTVIEGILTPSAAGELVLQVDCEGAGDVTVKKGSHIEIKPLLAA